MNEEQTSQFEIPEELRPARRKTASIVIHDGDEIGAVYSLTNEETVLGRTGDCDVVLPEDRVSRRHAVIRRVGPAAADFELLDLDSTNGTRINGRTVRRHRLRDGDKIAIGRCTMKFALLDEQDMSFQSKIVEMIHVDDLTGLLTKRSLFRALERELIRAHRYQRPLSVLMMDLDQFKLVNDGHGHLAGSHCLAEVGRLIRETTRSVDVNGRYGGDEFVSFLPETDTDDAVRLAERLRYAVRTKRFLHQGAEFGTNISIGIASFPGHGITVHELVAAADEALYCAKESGRDRVEVHEPEPATVG